jgi:eukaryotic-like serine/threonine-protein kinase
MAVSTPGELSIEELAEEFLERRRRGERPTLEEYLTRYPLLADEIREFFPVLGLVEEFKPGTDDLSGSIAGSSIPGLAVVPERLGDFRLLREVGRGGMGIVYEAEQESLGRRVALKVLRTHRLHDPKVVLRFHREAKAAARLHHTNIVPVFGVGEHDGAHFYVMQFIQGLSLDAVLAEVRRIAAATKPAGPSGALGPPFSPITRGNLTVADLAQSLATGRFAPAQLTEPGSSIEMPLSCDGADGSSVTLPGHTAFSAATDANRQYARSVARVGLQVAEALDYAHQHGVLHRDIKPSNLLLDAHGMVWVTDFGLAKVATEGDLTCTGDIVGTVRYMAPERFEGRCDARADVYSLGLTLYELLARRPAFESEDRLALIRQVTKEEPKALRQLDPTIPRDLHTIVHTAFAKDPEDRYATAAELRDELERFLAERPIRSRPISPPEHYWRWCKRNPGLAAVSTLACALTIAIAIVASLAAARNGRMADQLKAQRDEAHQNLIQAYMSEAEARLHGHRTGQRFDALDAIARATRLARSAGINDPDRQKLRNQAIAAMGLPDVRVGWQVEVPDPKRHGFTVDSSFERYAQKRDDGSVVIRRTSDDHELLELPGLLTDCTVMIGGFSDDGRYLAMMAFGQQSTLELWDLQARKLILTENNVSGSNTATWAFHPDSRQFAFGLNDGSIVFIDLADGRELRRWTDGLERSSSMAFSPDGSRLAVVPWRSDNRFVHILASDTGRAIAHLSNPAHVFHVAWNPRRPNLLAAGVEDNVIRVWDVAAGRQTIALEGDLYSGLAVAFHPGGDLLASRGWNSMLRLWDIRTGRQVLSLASPWLPELHFDRSGTRLSAHAASGHAGILEVSFQTECRALVRQAGPASSDLRALAIDRSGLYVAASDPRGLTIWDVASGTPLGRLPVTPGVAHALFDPSGAILTSHPLTLRWPISTTAGATTIGPPQLLSSDQTIDAFSSSADGRVVALAAYDGGGVVLSTDPANPSRRVLPHADTRGITVSPDGKWVVTASHTFGTIKVWDRTTGLTVHDFPANPRHRSAVLFSPDGRWLSAIFNEQGSELIETATWTSRRRFWNVFGPSAFSPDSATFAFETYEGSIVLFEPATGRELARFDDPDGSRAAQIVFSPDGSLLIATLIDQNLVRIWDLRAVRHRLAKLDLDWSPPPSWQLPPTAPPASWPSPPPAFRVLPGQLDKWIKLAAIRDREQAIADDERALAAQPGQPEVRQRLALACNNLAWELITGSPSSFDPPRALPLARRAIALTAGQTTYLNTLGLALYRVNLYREAIPILEQSLAAGKGEGAGYDLFMLALCYAKNGDPQRARNHVDRAISWLRSNPKLTPREVTELKAFREEAESLLRGPYPDLPESLFAPAKPTDFPKS